MKLTFAMVIAAMSFPTAANAAALSDAIRSDMPQLMTLYRDLHANPELSMQEVRTPAKLAPEIRKLGFQVTEKVGKTGVVAVMKNGPGPTLLIRADMDGLPVKEQTGLPFASKVRGKTLDGVESDVMHACRQQHLERRQAARDQPPDPLRPVEAVPAVGLSADQRAVWFDECDCERRQRR